MRITTRAVLAMLRATLPAVSAARGPGDPTIPFAGGFELPCRLPFDSVGKLLVVEIAPGNIWSVDAAGQRTLGTNQSPDPR